MVLDREEDLKISVEAERSQDATIGERGYIRRDEVEEQEWDVLSLRERYIRLKAKRDVYGARFPLEELDEDDSAPEVPVETRRSAVWLILDVGKFVLNDNVLWHFPEITVLYDGRLSLRWHSDGRSVTVFVPAKKDGRYVIVTKMPNEDARRIIEPELSIKYHVRALLCNISRP